MPRGSAVGSLALLVLSSSSAVFAASALVVRNESPDTAEVRVYRSTTEQRIGRSSIAPGEQDRFPTPSKCELRAEGSGNPRLRLDVCFPSRIIVARDDNRGSRLVTMPSRDAGHLEIENALDGQAKIVARWIGTDAEDTWTISSHSTLRVAPPQWLIEVWVNDQQKASLSVISPDAVVVLRRAPDGAYQLSEDTGSH